MPGYMTVELLSKADTMTLGLPPIWQDCTGVGWISVLEVTYGQEIEALGL